MVVSGAETMRKKYLVATNQKATAVPLCVSGNFLVPAASPNGTNHDAPASSDNITTVACCGTRLLLFHRVPEGYLPSQSTGDGAPPLGDHQGTSSADTHPPVVAASPLTLGPKAGQFLEAWNKANQQRHANGTNGSNDGPSGAFTTIQGVPLNATVRFMSSFTLSAHSVAFLAGHRNKLLESIINGSDNDNDDAERRGSGSVYEQRLEKLKESVGKDFLIVFTTDERLLILELVVNNGAGSDSSLLMPSQELVGVKVHFSHQLSFPFFAAHYTGLEASSVANHPQRPVFALSIHHRTIVVVDLLRAIEFYWCFGGRNQHLRNMCGVNKTTGNAKKNKRGAAKKSKEHKDPSAMAEVLGVGLDLDESKVSPSAQVSPPPPGEAENDSSHNTIHYLSVHYLDEFSFMDIEFGTSTIINPHESASATMKGINASDPHSDQFVSYRSVDMAAGGGGGTNSAQVSPQNTGSSPLFGATAVPAAIDDNGVAGDSPQQGQKKITTPLVLPLQPEGGVATVLCSFYVLQVDRKGRKHVVEYQLSQVNNSSKTFDTYLQRVGVLQNDVETESRLLQRLGDGVAVIGLGQITYCSRSTTTVFNGPAGVAAGVLAGNQDMSTPMEHAPMYFTGHNQNVASVGGGAGGSPLLAAKTGGAAGGAQGAQQGISTVPRNVGRSFGASRGGAAGMTRAGARPMAFGAGKQGPQQTTINCLALTSELAKHQAQRPIAKPLTAALPPHARHEPSSATTVKNDPNAAAVCFRNSEVVIVNLVQQQPASIFALPSSVTQLAPTARDVVSNANRTYSNADNVATTHSVASTAGMVLVLHQVLRHTSTNDDQQPQDPLAAVDNLLNDNDAKEDGDDANSPAHNKNDTYIQTHGCPECISYVENGMCFVGSVLDNSFTIQLNTGERTVAIENTGPILQLATTEENEPHQHDVHNKSTTNTAVATRNVIAAAGADNSGSIYMLRSAADVEELAEFEGLDGVNGMHGVGNLLFLNMFGRNTKILALHRQAGGVDEEGQHRAADVEGAEEQDQSAPEEEIALAELAESEPLLSNAFIEDEATLYVAKLHGNTYVQVTATTMNAVDGNGGRSTKTPIAANQGQTATTAVANAEEGVVFVATGSTVSAYVVATSGQSGKSQLIAEFGFPQEVSALTATSRGELLVGQWVTNSVWAISNTVIAAANDAASPLTVSDCTVADACAVCLVTDLGGVPRSIELEPLAKSVLATSTTVNKGRKKQAPDAIQPAPIVFVVSTATGSVSFCNVQLDAGSDRSTLDFTITSPWQIMQLGSHPISLHRIPRVDTNPHSGPPAIAASTSSPTGAAPTATGVGAAGLSLLCSGNRPSLLFQEHRRVETTGVGLPDVEYYANLELDNDRSNFPAASCATTSSVQVFYSAARGNALILGKLGSFRRINKTRMRQKTMVSLLKHIPEWGVFAAALRGTTSDHIHLFHESTMQRVSASPVHLLEGERCNVITAATIRPDHDNGSTGVTGGHNDNDKSASTTEKVVVQRFVPEKSAWNPGRPFASLIVGSSIVFAEDPAPKESRLSVVLCKDLLDGNASGPVAAQEEGTTHAENDDGFTRTPWLAADRDIPGMLNAACPAPNHDGRLLVGVNGSVWLTRWDVGEASFITEGHVTLGLLCVKIVPYGDFFACCDMRYSTTIVQVNTIDQSLEVVAKDQQRGSVMDIAVLEAPPHQAAGSVGLPGTGGADASAGDASAHPVPSARSAHHHTGDGPVYNVVTSDEAFEGVDGDIKKSTENDTTEKDTSDATTNLLLTADKKRLLAKARLLIAEETLSMQVLTNMFEAKLDTSVQTNVLAALNEKPIDVTGAPAQEQENHNNATSNDVAAGAALPIHPVAADADADTGVLSPERQHNQHRAGSKGRGPTDDDAVLPNTQRGRFSFLNDSLKFNARSILKKGSRYFVGDRVTCLAPGSFAPAAMRTASTTATTTDVPSPTSAGSGIVAADQLHSSFIFGTSMGCLGTVLPLSPMASTFLASMQIAVAEARSRLISAAVTSIGVDDNANGTTTNSNALSFVDDELGVLPHGYFRNRTMSSKSPADMPQQSFDPATTSTDDATATTGEGENDGDENTEQRNDIASLVAGATGATLIHGNTSYQEYLASDFIDFDFIETCFSSIVAASGNRGSSEESKDTQTVAASPITGADAVASVLNHVIGVERLGLPSFQQKKQQGNKKVTAATAGSVGAESPKGGEAKRTKKETQQNTPDTTSVVSPVSMGSVLEIATAARHPTFAAEMEHWEGLVAKALQDVESSTANDEKEGGKKTTASHIAPPARRGGGDNDPADENVELQRIALRKLSTWNERSEKAGLPAFPYNGVVVQQFLDELQRLI